MIKAGASRSGASRHDSARTPPPRDELAKAHEHRDEIKKELEQVKADLAKAHRELEKHKLRGPGRNGGT